MKDGFVLPTAYDITKGILRLKNSAVISKATVMECFPMLHPEYGSPVAELASGIIRIIQEEMPPYMFDSIDKKESIVKAIGDIVEEAELLS
ncbi:MAG: hypothetical protein K2M30_00395, partial [Desulfovibrionaceae bacterium]|nr:hypothetical protein [Desulfovibrionaceae bacterium]